MAEQRSFVLVSTFYPPYGFGGDAVHVARLAGGLAGRGHHVRVVHNPTAFSMLGGAAAPGLDGLGAAPGVEVVALPRGPMARSATLGTYVTGRATGYARELAALTDGADVVHLHNPSLLGGPAALHLGGPRAVRMLTTHEHWLLCATHVLFRDNHEVCTRRTCVRCTVNHGRPPQPWRATDVLRGGVEALHLLLCPSRYTAALHKATFPSARTEVLPLSVPRAVVSASSDPAVSSVAVEGHPYVMYAGRLEPIKGIDRFARAFASVRGADLVIAGSGSLASDLQAVAASNPNVRLVGQLDQSRLQAAMRGALALVVPSAGLETFGGAGAEAMALGVPIVVRDLGPLPELVEDGGGLVGADDAGLAAAVQRLVDEPGLAQSLGARAADVARTRFGEDTYLDRYLALIDEVAP